MVEMALMDAPLRTPTSDERFTTAPKTEVASGHAGAICRRSSAN
jgi:hypothetical protein